MNPLSLLGPVGSIVAVGGLVLSLAGGAWAIVHEHDKRVVAEVAAQQATVVAAAQMAQADRTIGELTTARNTAINRLNEANSVKEAIYAAPKSNACASSAPVRALVRGLRSRHSGDTGPTPVTTR